MRSLSRTCSFLYFTLSACVMLREIPLVFQLLLLFHASYKDTRNLWWHEKGWNVQKDRAWLPLPTRHINRAPFRYRLTFTTDYVIWSWSTRMILLSTQPYISVKLYIYLIMHSVLWKFPTVCQLQQKHTKFVKAIYSVHIKIHLNIRLIFYL